MIANNSAGVNAAIGFKGRMMTLTVLEISSLDLQIIEQALTAHVQKSPDFFRNMPVLLSLPQARIDLPALVALLRAQHLMPVALSNPSAEQVDAAAAAGLGVLNTAPGENRTAARPAAPEAAPVVREAPPSRSEQTPTKFITAPVRSGQQIYARNSDLIVTAAVSEGAEIIADGHIHVYGALRGRALAGATGDHHARIFCRRFEAELVAVAGCYQVAEDMQEAVRGKAVQVRLSDDNLLMELQE